jgi:hypothetical protein
MHSADQAMSQQQRQQLGLITILSTETILQLGGSEQELLEAL